MAELKKIKGTKDIYGEEVLLWQIIEENVRKIAKSFGLTELRTPVIEYTDVFKRAIGEETDIVSKEMFEFTDRGGRNICLRPEGTAGTVRAVVENSLHRNKDSRFFYMGPMFRAERPQKGRQRQFHQIGIEIFGDSSPYADLDVLLFNIELFDSLNLKNYDLKINSVGCPDCRPNYTQALKDFFQPHLGDLCENCNSRFENNPLRLLDCKNKNCANIHSNAPSILEHLCEGCESHFNELKTMLKALEVDFEVDSRIVRGLDYYSRTAFEIQMQDLGAQNAVCGGGRYDGLVSYFDAKNSVPGVGSAIGIERLILGIEAQNSITIPDPALDFYAVIAPGLDTQPAIKLMQQIRRFGLSCLIDSSGKNISKQLREAGKRNAHQVLIFGEDEIANHTVSVKYMKTGEQRNYRNDEFLSYLSGK